MAEKTVPTRTEDTPVAESEQTREEERYLVPPVDIYEQEDALVVVADIPGVKKEGVDINIENNILTIKAKAGYEKKDEYFFQEFGLRNYFRQFQLSEEVNQEEISAKVKNGVLTIHLPKVEKAKPRQIDVKME